MLARCEETNLVMNWEKCHFMIKEGIVLGHKISRAGIEVDTAKIDVIAKLPYPTNVKGVRSFLGHAGFYQRFIKDFSMISKTMTQLLMKDAKFDFSDDCKKAFNILKEKLTTAPIIISPDWNVPFELMHDASDFTVGYVLGKRIDGKFKLIYHANKTLNNAQVHYTTTEKELLAVVFSFDKFRPYLILLKTIVYTDHSALKYLFSKQDAKPRLISSPKAAPASPDYVPGPEEPKQVPLSPDYVSRLEYPEYLAPSDEEVPVEDQPYAVADSPIALSPGYVADSDPEEDPEEDSKDGPVDYPADGGDGDDDDSTDDDEEDEASKEEEHLAPADSVVVPVVNHAPSSEETESFEIDESAATPLSPPTYYTTARISIWSEAPMPFPSEEKVERLLALPPSPLISLSPPSVEERLARCLAAPALLSSPLLIIPHPYGSPNHVRAPPGFRAAIGRLRASSPSTHHPLHPSPPLPPLPSSLYLPPPIPTSSPLPSPPLPASLFVPSPVDRREDIPETELPPHKRLCLTTLTSRYKVGESSTSARPTRGHRADYRQFHQETALLLDQEALASQEAWAHSVGLSSAVHFKLYAYRTHTQMQDNRIASHESFMAALIAQNNMPPRRSSATVRAVAAATARAAATTTTPMTAAATTTPMTAAAVEQLIEARVSTALSNHETLRNNTNGQDDGSYNSDTGIRGTVRTLRDMIPIINCAVENQVKFATCTFLGNALTWWNSYMKTITQDVAYAMHWKALKKMMTSKYCAPRVKSTTSCTDVRSDVHEGIDEVEKYVGDFLDMNQE
ncbi:reverse transcriptase domain-containing protein [Tanacetum coccineum]